MAKKKDRFKYKERKRFGEGMRAAGKLASQILDEVAALVGPGISTFEIDALVDRLTLAAGAVSAPFGYRGFPSHCCTSINEVVCHGIPGAAILKEGDIVNVDVTPKLRGFHGDSSRMFCIGDVSEEAAKLCTAAYESLWLGIKAVTPGCMIDVIGAAIQPFAEAQGYSVVKQFCGHGIGKIFHRDPPIPHMIVEPGGIEFPVLKPGMAFTIEPMINLGGWEAEVQADNWTAITKDGSLSAQWEHTLLVHSDRIEVLTLSQEELKFQEPPSEEKSE